MTIGALRTAAAGRRVCFWGRWGMFWEPDMSHVMNTYARLPVAFARGEGCVAVGQRTASAISTRSPASP